MIKINEAKIGDFVKGVYEGKEWEGEITRVNHDEKQIGVDTGIQEFFFDEAHLEPIPLSDEQMKKLRFHKDVAQDGTIKYSKDAFRMVIQSEGDFSNIDMWYREDRRHHPNIKYVHQLQNQFLDMTKVHLTKELV